jgi:F-type H+-transporting ATPase subunit a
MAINPFEHVIDQPHWALLENLGWTIHLPLIGNFQITRFMILEVIAAVLVIAIYVPVARRAQSGEPPRGFFWNAFESILTFLRDKVAKPYIGEHDADRFVPLLWTMFLFILFCNLLGMVPSCASPTASLSVTGALAVVAFLTIHGTAVAQQGLGGYIKAHAPHVEGPFLMRVLLVGMIVGIELMGHFIKAFVLAVRLFANMFGGHTVLAVILLFIVMAKDAALFLFWPITIISVLGVTALSLLELFVAFLQAFIFVFLTALFLGSAMHPHH